MCVGVFASVQNGELVGAESTLLSSVDFKVKTSCRHNIQTAENFSRSVVSGGHLHVVGEVRTEKY